MKNSSRILIVDDDYDMRQTIKAILEEDNYDLAEAEDGNAAIRYIKNNPVDMIIVDIIMPDKDGIEVITETSVSHPHVKILSLSGGGLIDASAHLHTASQLGADDTLVKPFKNKELIEKVRNLIKKEKKPSLH
jgi:DNA-binding response OmpR family regulator